MCKSRTTQSDALQLIQETTQFVLQKREREAKTARADLERARQENEARAQQIEQTRRELEAQSRATEQARQSAEAQAREVEQARLQAEQARLQAEAQARAVEQARVQAASAQAQTAALTKELSELKATQTDRGVVLTVGDVLFATGKSDMAPGAQRSMDKLAAFLKKYPTRNVPVEGHTDRLV